MRFRKQPDQPPKCENCEKLEHELRSRKAFHDMIMSRTIKRDTDIINGLLKEIDALHLLLEEKSKNSDDKGEQCCEYIHNCQDMHF